MNNQCRVYMLVIVCCQLLREPPEKRDHEFQSRFKHDIIKTREMVLVEFERTWTFGLCSFYFLCNAVSVKSFAGDKKKDLVYVSDGRIFQKNYRFEDFFWTGTEDDSEVENSINNQTELQINLLEASPSETWKTTTVFHTTTILFATVYPNSESCLDSMQGCTPKISPVQTRSIEFSSPTLIPDFTEILPCPTQKIPQTDSLDFPDIYSGQDGVEGDANDSGRASTIPEITGTKTGGNGSVPRGFESDVHNLTNSTVFPDFSPDQQYWITTILRSDNFSRNLERNIIENKLSLLYKKAIRRRQEKYFGGNEFYERKDRKISQPVKVNILNVTRTGENVELLYYVSVAGHPVPAMTAANDMRLITTSEVIAELGYPILSKAEPYMKNVVPLGARVKGRTRDTWLFVGSVIAAVLLLIILAALFALELSKKRSKQSMHKELEKRRQVLEEEKGTSNLAFEGEVDAKGSAKSAYKSETKTGNEYFGVGVKFSPEERRESTSSSCSSSEASLVRLRHQQRKREMRMKEVEERPKPKPRTRIRKVENSDCTKTFNRTVVNRTGSALSRNTLNQVTVEGYDDSHFSPWLTRSPTSYLSMPSVKAFPRGTQIPESLNKILEPISIRHLDADSDSPDEYPSCTQISHKVDVEHVCEVKSLSSKGKALTRHASLEGDDPGFIGPVVWNRHCQNVVGGTVVVDGVNIEETASVGRMRKRFNELLDDALSMFGSRNPSPEGREGDSVRQTENRIYSAAVRPAGIVNNNALCGRPKTTGSRRPQSAVILGPKGAWETPSCSTLARSENAAVFQKLSSSPNVDKSLIYVNSDLAPSDPAVSLIAAIKSELKKFEEPSNENS